MIVNQQEATQLLEKYNVAGPRYTSYPPVPFWDQKAPNQEDWKGLLGQSFAKYGKEGISLYIHLPYCESLCTYCGCNTRITVNHAVEEPYITGVLREWDLYCEALGEKPVLRELHLGGGTPTFFSPENLQKLVRGILRTVKIHPDLAMSLEAHPANTSLDHLRILYALGFRRLSLGIQDFDTKVQGLINRHQTFAEVIEVVDVARRIGFESINLDLLYGLPAQTEESLKATINKALLLVPDRVAFYGYAHAPWMKPAQRSFEEHLPSPEARQSLYVAGKLMFRDAGYVEIGMDHFALPEDQLAIAAEKGELHRNFMGYTTEPTRMLIGLGVSSISDVWQGFAQNVKAVEPYLERVHRGELPIYRGHQHTEEDLIIRQHILNLMCHYETTWLQGLEGAEMEAISEAFPRLEGLQADGLVEWDSKGIRVLPKGRPYVRNVCMALDARLYRAKPQTQLFSKTV